MPIIEMHLMEGRTAEQKQAAASAITEAVTRTLGVKPESVRVLIHTLEKDGFYVAGETLEARAARLAQKEEAPA